MAFFELIHLYGITLIIIVGVFVIAIYGFSYLRRFFNFLRIRWRNYLSEDIFDLFEIWIGYTVTMLIVVFVIYILAQTSSIFKTYVWNIVTPKLLPFFLIFMTLLVSLILAALISRLFKYLRGDLVISPRTRMSPQISYFLEMLFKYIVYVIALFLTVILILSALNLITDLAKNVTSFFSKNISGFLWIIFIIIFSFIVSRFFKEIIKDIKLRSLTHKKKLDKALGLLIKITIGILSTVIIVIILFSMFGITNVVYIIITLMIFSLVLIFVAVFSTPFKNWVSGFIILATEPFGEGDVLSIEDLEQVKVLEIGFLYTRAINKRQELLYIPNSILLSKSVKIEKSTASSMPIFVQVSVNFEVPHNKVEDLLIKSARAVPEILDFQPRPSVKAKSIDGSFIIYELISYIENYELKSEILSALIFRIQESFLSENINIGSIHP